MTKQEQNQRYRDKARPQRRRVPHLTPEDPEPVALPHGLRQRVATQSYHARRMMSTVPIEPHVLKEPKP